MRPMGAKAGYKPAFFWLCAYCGMYNRGPPRGSPLRCRYCQRRHTPPGAEDKQTAEVEETTPAEEAAKLERAMAALAALQTGQPSQPNAEAQAEAEAPASKMAAVATATDSRHAFGGIRGAEHRPAGAEP